MEEPGGYAFISYAREDSGRADELQESLEAAGIRVWRDKTDLWPGQDWRMVIRRAITDGALVFIACFSSQSTANKKGYQNEELVLAVEQLRQRRPGDPWLIPVRFDECRIPDLDIGGGRTLDYIQCTDLFGDHDVQMKRLVEAVQRLLGQDTAGQDSGAKRASPGPEPVPQVMPAPQVARGRTGRPGDSGIGARERESEPLNILEAMAENETPALTTRWRAARGHEGSAARQSTERIFDHPAYRRGTAEPPAFLISTLLPCQPLGDSQPSPDGTREQFRLLLARPAFMDLITEASATGPGFGWRPAPGRGRRLLESHLCASTQDPGQLPVASVKLILPDLDLPTYGSDQDRADLFVRINLPSYAASLLEWRERFSRALALPGHLASFLTGELRIPAVGRPAEACLRIVARQEAPGGLAEVVDVSMFEILDARYVPHEFVECRTADPDGNEITAVARKLAQNLAETLHATGYEQALDSRPA